MSSPPPNPDAKGRLDIDDKAFHPPEGLRPLVDVWMRDPRVTTGHDGAYYLIGTTRLDGQINAGSWANEIRLWRSDDLRAWESLGVIWTLDENGGRLADFPVYENGAGKTYPPEAFLREIAPRLDAPMSVTPEAPLGDPGASVPIVRRGIWSPDIYWLGSRREYLLTFCLNTNIAVPPAQWTAHGLFGGNYFLKCPGGDPRGPWELVSEQPLTDHIDGSIFEEDDGSVWFVWQNGRMARFNATLDGFDQICDPWQTPWNPEPTREGPFVVQRDGRHHLFLTVHSHRLEDGGATYAHAGHGGRATYSYDLIQASADRLTGPYGPRSLVALGGGHGHPFKDREGRWWLAAFGNPHDPFLPFPVAARPYLIPMRWIGERFLPDHNPSRLANGLPA